MQRRYWTLEEDSALKIIVQSMPEVNWTLASLRLKSAVDGSDRNSKQCRQRWLNKLNRKDSDDSPWSTQQDQIILQQFITNHKCEKNKWIILADKLKSCSHRAPNEIKNRFYSIVRKGIRRINNKLGRPILPEEIRLIKPITTSKLFQSMEEQECRQMLYVIYAMTEEKSQNHLLGDQFSDEKLYNVLQTIINLNRAEQKLRTQLKSSQKLENEEVEDEIEQPIRKQTLKKRKSSLSTVEQQKIEILNKSIQTYACEENHREVDIIDIFIDDCLHLHQSISLQFEEIDFGL